MVLAFLYYINNTTSLDTLERTAPNRDQNPDLRKGYKKFLLRSACLDVTTWVFIGVATLSGEVETILDVLDFKIGIWGSLFYISIIASSVFTFIYVFAFNGAETLAKFSLLSQGNAFAVLETAKGQKLGAIIVLLAPILFIAIMFYRATLLE